MPKAQKLFIRRAQWTLVAILAAIFCLAVAAFYAAPIDAAENPIHQQKKELKYEEDQSSQVSGDSIHADQHSSPDSSSVRSDQRVCYLTVANDGSVPLIQEHNSLLIPADLCREFALYVISAALEAITVE